jgi:hypothetical protein
VSQRPRESLRFELKTLNLQKGNLRLEEGNILVRRQKGMAKR